MDEWSETRIPPRFNVAPSQTVAAVRLNAEGRREFVSLRWGLIPHWAKEPKLQYSTINARAETVATKPAYRAAFRRRRCLIPADGFYEWQRVGKSKQPWHIRRADGDLFAFAGLWEHWQGADGQVIESCTVIVTEANELLRPLHDRMPVIVDPADYDAWLDAEHFEPAKLQGLLRPYPAEPLVAYPVSTRVNSPAHDDELCVAPVDAK